MPEYRYNPCAIVCCMAVTKHNQTQKEATIPAQVLVTRRQLRAMLEDLEDDHEHLIICEAGPAQSGDIDVWVMDDPTLESNTHRSVIIDSEGNILGDHQLPD